jgi:hypothetical protein
MDSDEKDYLKFKVHQTIKNVFKNFLLLLEEMADRDQISEEDFEFYRKRVLDNGNENIRNLTQEIDKFN